MHRAAALESPEVLHLLLNTPCVMEDAWLMLEGITDSSRRLTPLLVAITHNRSEAVDLLLDFGALQQGGRAILLAKEHAGPRIMKRLDHHAAWSDAQPGPSAGATATRAAQPPEPSPRNRDPRLGITLSQLERAAAAAAAAAPRVHAIIRATAAAERMM